MAMHVCNGAVLQCSFGIAPSTLIVLPINRVLTSSQPAATINDFVPMVNIMPFGMCTTPSNPMVASLTAAAMGTPTPAPCIPVTTSPWVPGAPTVLEGGIPVLDNNCKCMCTWGGVIAVTMPGQMTEMVP